MSTEINKDSAQPLPVEGVGVSCHELVAIDVAKRYPSVPASKGLVADLRERKEFGLKKYDTLLQAKNGRDAKLDLYEELLDAAVYVKQSLEEVEIEMQEMGMSVGHSTHHYLTDQHFSLKQIYTNILSSLVSLWNIRDEEVFTNM